MPDDLGFLYKEVENRLEKSIEKIINERDLANAKLDFMTKVVNRWLQTYCNITIEEIIKHTGDNIK